MSEEPSQVAIPTDFRSVPLSDISYIEMGQSPDSNYVSDDPYVGYAFLQGNAEFGVVSPTPKFGCIRPAKLARNGDILISVRAPVGAVNVADRDYCIGRGLAAVRAPQIAPNLLAYLLSREAPALRKVAQGTTFEAIGKSELHSLRLTMPPEKELGLISCILDTLDTAIRETEAIIAKLKTVKQGLLHDLLTRGIDANGELRPPQAEAPHLYKQSPLGWIPKEWDAPLLDEVSKRGSGHTPNKDTPSYWNGGIKWVSLADSRRLDMIYIRETDKEISALGIANSSAVLHPSGTVVLSRDAGIGKSGILSGEMAVSQHFIAWACGELLNNLYLYFWLQHEKPRFEAIAIGSTIKTIGLPFFKAYRVPVPSRTEQDQVVRVLLGAEEGVARHDMELGQLRQLKVGLMDDLLTGRVRVTSLRHEHGGMPQ